MFSAESWENWKPILYSHGAEAALSLVHILVIAIAGWVATRFVRKLIQRFETVFTRPNEEDDYFARVANEKRVKTLAGVLRTMAVIVIWSLVIMSGLNEFGLNLGPILAGVGIAGLAVGFGAQNLVRDVISGFFLILENQVRVGDVAVVNGTGGSVESISFRTIVLRDLAGTVHVFPHGAITTLSNMTMYWSAYVVDISIAYEQDIDRTMAVMRRVHEALAADADFRDKIISPIEVFGVENVTGSEVQIKARLRTRPADQWDVGREYRRRLKYAFDREGIVRALPQCIVQVAPPSSGLQAAMAGGAE